MDLRMDASGKAWVIEANPNPQLAEREDFALSALRAGMGYAVLLERIMSLGLRWLPHRMAME
jgi:D-alanine-D-alanine ligase